MKKMMALLLSCVVACSALVACGGSSSTTNDGNGTAAEGTAVATGSNGPFVAFNPFQYNNVEEDWLNVQAAMEAEMADEGITMDWVVVPTDGMLEKLNVMLAGGEQLDLVILNVGDADKYISQPDLMMPLDDLLAEYGQDLLANIPEEAWIRCRNTKGEIMYIPDHYQWRWQGCVIREDLLDEQGLDMPTNIPELENVMAVFKEAYPDMLPATGLPWFSDPFLQGAMDTVSSWQTAWALDADGNVVPSRTLPEYKEFLALYKKWVDNGWYDPEFMNGTDDSQSLLWTTGRVGIWFCDPHRALDWNHEAFKLNFPEGKGNFLPILANSAGEKNFPIDYGVGIVGWIPQESEHAVEVIKYLNKLVSDPDFYRLGSNGILGEHWVDLGDEWDYPEGMDPNHNPYDKLLAPLSWEFLDIQKPRTKTNPETDWVHDALNAEYATAGLIMTGLEGFVPDEDAVAQYNPIELDTYLPQIIVTDMDIDEFDNIVEQWYTTGGQEIVEEYTRQYQEWLATGE